jgi:MFS family permease
MCQQQLGASLLELCCCLVAAAVTTLGWGLSALVAEPWQLLLTYSVLVGVGHSLALHSAIVCIGRWFSSKLALAHALPNTGGALSPLLMGMLAPRLFDAAGWRGAFLVLGGINGAALLADGLRLEHVDAGFDISGDEPRSVVTPGSGTGTP